MTRTATEAFRIAKAGRDAAIARGVSAADAGRDATKLYTGLLMTIRAEDGGLQGLPDETLELLCKHDRRLSLDDAREALWCPPAWPNTQSAVLA